MIAARIQTVREQIASACLACGRDPNDVGLIAVSKTHPARSISEAMATAQVDFGENYAQEMREKAEALATATPAPRWHFIGRIQSNKAAIVARYAYRIHALSEVRHAEALAAKTTDALSVLVAVNLGDEASKAGVSPNDALHRCRDLARVPRIRVVGLMALPPPHEDPEASAPYFEELADLARRGRADGLALNELSMGMSHDFHVAIRHGATWVRVGTAVFGRRQVSAG
jgi:pyridoxal phosphate enzyme (YggS family)